MKKVNKNNLKIDENLIKFINEEAIPGTGLDSDHFWKEFSNVVHELAPKNKNLIKKREEIQKKIDDWHLSNKGSALDKNKYTEFLKSINYIVEEKDNFKINTSNVDEEISSIAGPQLVVPVDNARYALNAANARWGSLYDAIYGTDVISENKVDTWDKQRAIEVINYVREFFDKIIPIENTSWKNISKIKIENNNLVFLVDDKNCNLKNKNQFVGFSGEKNNPKSILFKNNNLHIDVIIDENSKIGKTDKAGISDIIVESAISTIVDNEDSVAAVDSVDKVKCYRNWLGLMKGDLKTEVNKNGKTFVRKLNSDITNFCLLFVSPSLIITFSPSVLNFDAPADAAAHSEYGSLHNKGPTISKKLFWIGSLPVPTTFMLPSSSVSRFLKLAKHLESDLFTVVSLSAGPLLNVCLK